MFEALFGLPDVMPQTSNSSCVACLVRIACGLVLHFVREKENSVKVAIQSWADLYIIRWRGGQCWHRRGQHNLARVKLEAQAQKIEELRQIVDQLQKSDGGA